MSGNTALIILLIAIIGIIAIIIVKLYYRDESRDKEISSLSDLRPSFLDKESELGTKPRYSEEDQFGQRREQPRADNIRTQSAHRTAPRAPRTAPRAPRQERPQTQPRRQSPSRSRPPAHKRLEQDMARSQAAAVSTNIDPARVRAQREKPKPTREAPKAVVEKPVSVIKKENTVYEVDEEKILKEKEPQTLKEPVTEVPKVTKEPEAVRKPVTEVPKVTKEPETVKEPVTEVPKVTKEPEAVKEPVTEVPKVTKEPETAKDNVDDLKNLFTIDELIKESKRKEDEEVEKTPIVKEEIIDKIEEPTVITPVEETPKAETVPEVKPTEESPKAETVVETPKVEETTVVEEVDESPIIKPLNEEITSDEFEIKEDEFLSNQTLNKAPEVEDKEEFADLDYRKDLEKIKNVVKSSKFLSDIKNKITPEVQDNGEYNSNDSFHRSVGNYKPANEFEGNNPYFEAEDFGADDWEPIIPEPQPDYEYEEKEYRPLSASEQLDEDLRLENTRKVYNMAKQPKPNAELKKPAPKVKITSISFNLNNEEVTLNKNDEIIYKIDNDTYSSRVLAIQGDDIIVRYRGKNRAINIDAVKKIY